MRISGKVKNYLECIDSKRGIWKLRWNFQKDSFEEQTLNHKPSMEEIQNIIYSWYNQEASNLILSGFQWKGYQVWLSQENQLNYKTVYDLAVQSAGISLPVRFKFGTNKNPKYYTFSSLSELTDFYTSMVKYIQQVLDECWSKKDNINWTKYE